VTVAAVSVSCSRPRIQALGLSMNVVSMLDVRRHGSASSNMCDCCYGVA
jgi:hypothetical protein